MINRRGFSRKILNVSSMVREIFHSSEFFQISQVWAWKHECADVKSDFQATNTVPDDTYRASPSLRQVVHSCLLVLALSVSGSDFRYLATVSGYELAADSYVLSSWLTAFISRQTNSTYWT